MDVTSQNVNLLPHFFLWLLVHPVTGATTLYLFYAGDAVYTVGPAPAHARTYDIHKFGIGLMTCELLARVLIPS